MSPHEGPFQGQGNLLITLSFPGLSAWADRSGLSGRVGYGAFNFPIRRRVAINATGSTVASAILGIDVEKYNRMRKQAGQSVCAFGSAGRAIVSSVKLAGLRRRGAAKQAFRTQVFVDIRPVNAVAAAGDLPILSLGRRSVEQARIPCERTRSRSCPPSVK